jgi:hypothetical protein
MAYHNPEHNVQFDMPSPRGQSFLLALAGTAKVNQTRKYSPHWGQPEFLTVLAAHWRPVPAWAIRIPTARPLASTMVQPNAAYRVSPVRAAFAQSLPKK